MINGKYLLIGRYTIENDYRYENSKIGYFQRMFCSFIQLNLSVIVLCDFCLDRKYLLLNSR